MHKYDIPDTVSENNVRCALGINKKTGRLQWCPGYCNLSRILILIPATMIPICLLFLLFTHVGNTRTSHGGNFRNERRSIKTRNIETPLCRTVPSGLSETILSEEREILKDIRTSFIPYDLIVIPPNCRDPNDPNWDSNNDENKINYEQTNVSEYLKRRRRSHTTDANDTSEMVIDSIDNTNPKNVDYDFDDDEPPWKISTDCDPPSNTAELEEGEDKKTWNCDRSSSMAFHAFWKGEGSPEKIRSTQAEMMKQYMDTSVHPCEDFYQYACGNWEKINPIPKDKAAYDTFEMLRESLDSVLRDLLNSKQPIIPRKQEFSKPCENSSHLSKQSSINCNKSDEQISSSRLRRNIFRRRRDLKILLEKFKNNRLRREMKEIIDSAEIKAQNLYQSCMDYSRIEKRGVEPLLSLLKRIGGWPVLNPNNWDESKFDWLELTAKLRCYNNDVLIAEWVGPDIKNSEENIIQFDQTSLGLPTRDYFLQDTNLQYLNAYEVFMSTTIKLLGTNSTNSSQAAMEIVKFEKELAEITSSPEERTNVSVLYNKMDLKSLHQLIPQIDWTRYLTIVLERPVHSNESIVMFATKYMQNLVDLLSRTDKQTIANYVIWRFVRHRINNLDDRFQDAKQKFYKVLFGREQSPPRWKNCVNQVNSNLGMAVGAMFVRKYFDENSKRDTLKMTNELQASFREILNTIEWIEPSTKLLAELKVNAMSLKIGYPDYILSHDELNNKYKDLQIDPDKYFENTLSVLIHLTRHEHNKLGQPVNKTVWHTAPAVVNAYYSRNKNQIMFPAGILQPPFYHRHFPKSLNYGGIGVVIGHELTHGFDDKGRLFDRDGNLHRWWTEMDIQIFHERAQCLISQYGNYTVAEVGIKVDGENTQGENIADNGGIKQAFRAYNKWLEHNPTSIRNEVLPGINATHTQLFFLNFAQVWCGAMRPEATRSKLKTAVHSPGKFRVIGTLSNSDEFAKEYNCPIGSPMNPNKKCIVW